MRSDIYFNSRANRQLAEERFNNFSVCFFVIVSLNLFESYALLKVTTILLLSLMPLWRKWRKVYMRVMLSPEKVKRGYTLL